MGKPKVLLLGQIDHATATWDGLADVAELVATTATNRAELLAACAAGQLDGVYVVCDRAPHSFAVTGRIDKELVDALPASVRYICHNGAGYDSIDVAACTARGIRVSNTPGVVDDATADAAMFLILAALRGFNNGLLAIRNRTWLGATPPPPLGRDPRGKVLGILGMGGIGRNLARKAAAFGMRVVYHSRTAPREEEEKAAAAAAAADAPAYVDTLDELLAVSDVLSVHIPLTAATRNYISARELAKMKRGAVLVNTARGGVVDEDALVAALASGQLGSAGLDVYQREPDIHPGLLANPHICLLPHMGTSTVETKARMEEWNLANVRAALEGRSLSSVVPEQAGLL